MTNRSKSTLFLIEQLIVIAVFAICAVACISILTTAYFYANDSNSTRNALFRAESAAEIFKATGGDVAVVTSMLESTPASVVDSGGVVTIHYNSSWQPVSQTDASYRLNITSHAPEQIFPGYSLVTGEIIVVRITGETLITLPLAARVISATGGDAT